MEGSMTLDPKIYRRAAEIVAENSWCCCRRIDEQVGGFDCDEATLFAEYFKPTPCTKGFWLGPLTKAKRLRRSLALLFMEQIAMDLMKEKNL